MQAGYLRHYLAKIKKLGEKSEIPNISLANAEAIVEVLQKRKFATMLEIGTATGYSTLHFAIGCPQMQITTIEHAYNIHCEAVKHIRHCKCKNVHCIWGEAQNIIPTLQDKYFDVVFIDGMKKEYKEYLIAVLPKLTQNALIIVDDVEKFAHKMQDFYDFLEQYSIEYSLQKTDTDDSIMYIEAKNLKKSHIGI
ncbi:hypothetical protein CSB09_00340 [Candidatus Gracilibacteria bacterium]|nr:MAG: hypothetical protein CSB09_00340 [Candidatus Gracilibacteria bacterium]